MTPPVRVVLFDVNETLSDMAPLEQRFEEIGAPPHLLAIWFAGVLRDGFALTASGGYASFRDVAEAVLRPLLDDVPGRRGNIDVAVGYVLAGFGELDVHPDVPDGVRRLAAGGLRLATLTNGSAELTDALLRRAGLRDHFEALLDVGGPGAWKPAADAYRYALQQLNAEADETMLVAVHPWDIAGARRAGLQAAWVRRAAREYPSVMEPPTVTATDMRDLAAQLTA